MVAGFVLLFGFAVAVWLVFFRFKWLKFTIPWGVVSLFFGLHLLIIFLIGLRFVTPLATEAKIIQHTIQLIPRLPEPTLVTAVLVEPNVPVKKGQGSFSSIAVPTSTRSVSSRRSSRRRSRTSR